MTEWLKQSTSVSVVIGPIWATADGALKADLAYNASGINCDIYKNGTKADVTLANSAGDGYFRAASGEAMYLLTLSTGHTDTLGRLTITLSATGYYCKPVDYMIVPANVWDSLFGADYLQVDAVQVEGSDATNQIRDAVVDDATRIDASALNTLSGHDPGEAIMGATDLGTGAGLTSLASAANLATVAGYVDTEVAAVLAAVDTEVAAIKAKTDNLPASPAAVGSAMTLTSAYDAAKTAASQSSVNTIDDFLDTEVAAILADTNELQTDLTNGGRLDLLIDAIKAKTDNLPADPADDSDIDTQLAAIAGYLDTEVAAILAAVDTEVAAIKAKTDNLPASPAAVGSAMTLANGAVTSAAIATGAIDADALAADAGTEIGAAVKTAVEAAGSHLDILKTIAAHKSIENEAGTSVTYRNAADDADAGSQSWTEAAKTRGAYTPS